MNDFDKKSIAYKREMLREKLVQFNSRQQNKFNRMYGSIDDIPEEKMSWAYQQCVNTLNKTVV